MCICKYNSFANQPEEHILSYFNAIIAGSPS